MLVLNYSNSWSEFEEVGVILSELLHTMAMGGKRQESAQGTVIYMFIITCCKLQAELQVLYYTPLCCCARRFVAPSLVSPKPWRFPSIFEAHGIYNYAVAAAAKSYTCCVPDSALFVICLVSANPCCHCARPALEPVIATLL